MEMIEATRTDRRRLLGTACYFSEAERDWFERHEPWLWRQLERGSTRWAEEPAHAVNRALEWIFEHAEGRRPGWDQLDVWNLLLEEMPLFGVPDGLSRRAMLVGLQEFVSWMAEQDKLALGTARRIVSQVDACEQRFLALMGQTDEDLAEVDHRAA